MSECEHKWHFYEESIDGCFCVRGCRGRLGRGKAEAMLNEYAALKREAEERQALINEMGWEVDAWGKFTNGFLIDKCRTLKRGTESAHLHLLASICECGEPLKETDAFDVLDALLTAEEQE